MNTVDEEIVNEGMNLAEKQEREEGWLRWMEVEEVLVHDGRRRSREATVRRELEIFFWGRAGNPTAQNRKHQSEAAIRSLSRRGGRCLSNQMVSAAVQIFPLQVSTTDGTDEHSEANKKTVSYEPSTYFSAHCGLLPSQATNARSRRRLFKPGDGHGELLMESTHPPIST